MADNSLQLYETREKDTKWRQIPRKRKHHPAHPGAETAMIWTTKETVPPEVAPARAVETATVPADLPPVKRGCPRNSGQSVREERC